MLPRSLLGTLLRAGALGGSLLAAACAPSPIASGPETAASIASRERSSKASLGREASVDIALARKAGQRSTIAWRAFDEAAFAEAEKEHKLILVDGAAAWCHWCHVMDETTYADPEVLRTIADRFVAVRFDVDARPDLAERYGEWGWPATIVLSAQGEELGKLRGYVPKSELLPALLGANGAPSHTLDTEEGPSAPLDALPWLFAQSKQSLDEYYDDEHGGWGRRQKTPIGEAAELGIVLGLGGDAVASDRARRSLVAASALADPFEGGLYQYSAGSTWSEPHYEKLMAVQASNLEAYARAYGSGRDPRMLATARGIEHYMNATLSSPEGGFYATQDADVNAHERTKPFVEGKVYYARDLAGRRALGAPRIDTHEYAYENGLAIAAMVTLYEATRDPDVLSRARKAADRVLATHCMPDGAVKHAADSSGGEFLADAASLGRGLARLGDATGDLAYRDPATKIARHMLLAFEDPRSAALYGRIRDEHAVGVFARRRHPFADDVLAARFLGMLARVTGDTSFRDRGLAILAAISKPAALEAQGRMVGGYLLALRELGIR